VCARITLSAPSRLMPTTCNRRTVGDRRRALLSRGGGRRRRLRAVPRAIGAWRRAGRWWSRAWVLAGGVGIVAAAASVAPVLAPAASRAWTVQPTPSPKGAAASALAGVSCATPRGCEAVGYSTTGSGVGVMLAERWNGARWSIQQTGRARGARASLLFGVACPAWRGCVAVGSVTSLTGRTVPLTGEWGPHGWSRARGPVPANVTSRSTSYLAAVACARARSCAAVGYSGNRAGTAGVPLAERWNGRRWALVPIPDPPAAMAAFLSGVSCTATDACVAVGFLTTRAGAVRTLAERWDGASWAIVPAPTPEGATALQLEAVSCGGANACVAVPHGLAADQHPVRGAVGWPSLVARRRPPAPRRL
jgi:hypothetical protein